MAVYSQSLVSHPSALSGEGCTAACQDTPQLTGHPLCPSVCVLRGPASPQGMVEDALCWASCMSARGHLLPGCCAWEMIYLVSYDFVFPCANIWEAQLMFCAQLRQLQPSAQLCTPGPLMEISPAMPLPRAKGEIPVKAPQWNTASSAQPSATPLRALGAGCAPGAAPQGPAVLRLPFQLYPGWSLQLFQGLKMCRGDFPAVPGVPLQLRTGGRGLQLSMAG